MSALRIPQIVVIGGGTVGSTTGRLLLRAMGAGRLECDRILVIDRNPSCAAAALGAPVTLIVNDWSRWLEQNMDGLGLQDHLVPDHFSPHLLREWLFAAMRRRGAEVAAFDGLRRVGLPYMARTRDGDLALSYAAWTCPPRCIEPTLCPHTRTPKDWSLADDLARAAPGEAWDDHLVFRCLHLVYGVGTVPVADIFASRDRLVQGLEHGRQRYLIATSSHCHALACAVEVRPGPRPVS